MIRIMVGNCLDLLRQLPAESIQATITSPPYYGLRDYGIEPTIWGGDPACPHDFDMETTSFEIRTGGGLAALGERYRGGGKKQTGLASQQQTIERGFCRCGAWRGVLGLEPNYRMYVDHMVEVFREVWRVLRQDGTLWLNLGDCFATGAGSVGKHPGGGAQGARWAGAPENDRRRAEGSKHDLKKDDAGYGPMTQPNRMPQPGLSSKNLMGIPWRVAFALQDDGWTLRKDVIWHKLNPMPESTYDRPTTSHEYLFLFVKSARTLLWRHRDGRWTPTKPEPDFIWRDRQTREERTEPGASRDWIRVNLWRGFDYYYDFAGIMEPSSPDSHTRAAKQKVPGGWDIEPGTHGTIHRQGRTKATYVGVGSRTTGPNSREHLDRTPRSRKLADHDASGPRPKANDSYDEALRTADLVPMRNKRSVWAVASDPFSEAHFATFPSALIRPCIIAGAPRFACGQCGVALDQRYARTRSSTEHMQMVRRNTASGPQEPNEEILQQNLRGEMVGKEPTNDKRLHDKLERLPPSVEARPPECDPIRIHDGASTSDGTNTRTDAPPDRSSASQGRQQIKQRPRKPGTHDQAEARQDAEAPHRNDPLSSLPREDHDFSVCPNCRAALDKVGVRGGLVLDCFGGAGTTGLVADELQRHAILMEASGKYAEMARRRIADKSPLLTEVAIEPAQPKEAAE